MSICAEITKSSVTSIMLAHIFRFYSLLTIFKLNKSLWRSTYLCVCMGECVKACLYQCISTQILIEMFKLSGQWLKNVRKICVYSFNELILEWQHIRSPYSGNLLFLSYSFNNLEWAEWILGTICAVVFSSLNNTQDNEDRQLMSFYNFYEKLHPYWIFFGIKMKFYMYFSHNKVTHLSELPISEH